MFSANGRKLITLDKEPDKNNESNIWGPHRLRHWDAASGKQEKLWLIPGNMYKPVVAPNGLAVLVANGGGIRLHDAQSAKDREFRCFGTPEMRALAVSPDGRVLASGDWGPPLNFLFMGLSDSGIESDIVIDRGDYCAVRLWEMATGKEILVLKGHECAVTSVAWSPDGRIVAAGDNNKNYGGSDKAVNSVRLWDAVTGKELARYGGLGTCVNSLAFSPDGAYLAGGFQDSTILVWDVRQSTTVKLATKQLQAVELEVCWADLAGEDARQAHQAIWTLIGAPNESAPFLRVRLKPVAANGDQVQQWIADLASAKFAVRQAATKELEKAGRHDQVKALMQKALGGKMSLEARRRLEQVMNDLPDILDSSTLRIVRAVMVLEKINSPEAQGILSALAKGAPGARETEEAQAALDRLERKSSRILKTIPN
jgi:hypothetical protein